MESKLIDQFIEATQQWSERTGHSVSNVTSWAVGQIGLPPRQTREESLSADLRTDIMQALQRTGVSPTLLITGLIKAVEMYLADLAMKYDKSIEVAQKIIDNAQLLAEHPEILDEINEERLKEGQPPLSSRLKDPEQIQKTIEFHTERINNVNDNEAERKMTLLAWQEIMSPLIEYSNLWPIFTEDLDNWYLPYLPPNWPKFP